MFFEPIIGVLSFKSLTSKFVVLDDYYSSISQQPPMALFRSSFPEVLLGKGVLKYAANLQENTHAEKRFQ